MHHLKDLMEYNHHANQQFIELFTERGFREEEAIRLFSHLINAHHTWLARIQSKPPMFDIWEIHLVNSFAQVDKNNHQSTFKLLAEQNPDQMVEYNNSSGKRFRNSLQEIFTHIVNHSTYHRGQLARICRQTGYNPPATDYIFYKRSPL